MNRLVACELKKIFANRYIIPALLLFLVLAFFQDFMQYNTVRPYTEAQREFYQKYGGVLTEEKYYTILSFANMEDTTDENGWMKQDYLQATIALDQISYMISFAKTNNSILERAQDNIEYFTEKGYPEYVRVNEQILALYQNTRQPQLVPSESWKDFFTSYFGCRFLAYPILLIVLLVSNIFSKEHESNLYLVVKSSKLGLTKSYWAKLIATTICSVGVMLFFILSNLIVKSFTSCLYGWDAPVRSIVGFEYSWLNLTILQTVILFSGCMCLGAIFFGLLILVISSFIRKDLFSIAAAFAFSIISYIWAYAFQYYPFIYTMTLDISSESNFINNLINSLRSFIPVFLLEPFYYFENYHYVLVGSTPVPTVMFNICVNVILISVLIYVSYRAYTNMRYKKVPARWHIMNTRTAKV